MKNPKKKAPLALKKVVSLMLITALIAMATACNEAGNGQIDDRVEVTTRDTAEQIIENDVEEPNQSIATIETTTEATTESTTEETTVETTAELPKTTVTGEFDYTLYEGTEYQTTLYMDLNAYYFTGQPEGNDGLVQLQSWELAGQYNWLDDGQYTMWELYDDVSAEFGTHTLGHSLIYTYPCDGYRVYLEISIYDDEYIGEGYYGDGEKYQIQSISISYVQNDSLEPAFADPSPEQMGVTINFGRHLEDSNCIFEKKPVGGSFNDLIVYQYVIWACSKYPGDSSVLYGYFQNPTVVDGKWVIELP